MTQLLETLAAQYIRGKGQRLTDLESATFRGWLYTQFNRIRGIVDFTEAEVTPATMVLTYYQTGRLLISTAHNHHPVLLPIENAWFRAVHDWHHLQSISGYDLPGELQTALYSISTAPREIHWILWSEVVLQAAATIKTGSYQRQKLVRV